VVRCADSPRDSRAVSICTVRLAIPRKVTGLAQRDGGWLDRHGLALVEVFEGGLEDEEAVGFAGAAGEEGVVLGMHDAFGMGHEAEDAAGGVADAGDGVGAAVGESGE